MSPIISSLWLVSRNEICCGKPLLNVRKKLRHLIPIFATQLEAQPLRDTLSIYGVERAPCILSELLHSPVGVMDTARHTATLEQSF
jgi:hypothetical protein